MNPQRLFWGSIVLAIACAVVLSTTKVTAAPPAVDLAPYLDAHQEIKRLI
jgi:hypothetical protein